MAGEHFTTPTGNRGTRRIAFVSLSGVVALALLIAARFYRNDAAEDSLNSATRGPELSALHVASAESGDARVEHGAQLVITVVDDAGTVVPEVEVLVALAAGEQRLGRTDSVGRVVTSEDLSATTGMLTARAPNFGCDGLTLPSAQSGNVQLTLHRASTIGGWVTADSRTADVDLKDVRVFAYPSNHYPSQAAIEALIAEGAKQALATTESDGRFNITGLDWRETYTVVAGGHGLISSERAKNVRAGETSLEIRLSGLFAALIEVREPSGRKPRTSERLLGPRGLGCVFDNRSTTECFAQAVEVRLAGLSAQYADARYHSLYDRLFLVSGSTGRHDGGEVNYDLDLPGYQPIAQRAVLQPLAAEIPRTLCLAKPLDDSLHWGSVEMIFIGGRSSAIARRQDGATWAELMLRPRAGTTATSTSDARTSTPRWQSLGFWSSSEVSDLIDGIPSGDYDVFWQTGEGFFRYPDSGTQLLTVLDDEHPAHLAIDLSSLSEARFEIVDEDPAAPAELLMAAFFRVMPDGSRKASRMLMLESQPFVVPTLPAGEYWVNPYDNFRWADTGDSMERMIQIAADEPTVLRIKNVARRY